MALKPSPAPGHRRRKKPHMEGHKSMKKLFITIAAIGLSTAAFAQGAVSFASVDTDTSAGVSLAEAQVAWPDLTQEVYEAADTNKDGQLDQAEFDAYVATLPTM
jgi:hypothetical protein